MPHRLGDLGDGVLVNLATNRLEAFRPWGVPRKPGDLLLVILESEVLTAPSNVESRAGECPLAPGGLAGGGHCTVSGRIPPSFPRLVGRPQRTLCPGSGGNPLLLKS